MIQYTSQKNNPRPISLLSSLPSLFFCIFVLFGSTLTASSSSEIQGLPAGTKRHFRAKVHFKSRRAPGNPFLPKQPPCYGLRFPRLRRIFFSETLRENLPPVRAEQVDRWRKPLCVRRRQSYPAGPPHWLARKIFFWTIRGTEFYNCWNWFGKNKFPGCSPALEANFRPTISPRPG